MERGYLRPLLISALLCVGPLQGQQALAAAPAPRLQAFVNASCVVADEPFLLPGGLAAQQQTRRSAALLGMVVGRLTEAFLSRTFRATSGRIAKRAARKDTIYTSGRNMNLFRADLQSEPRVELNADLGCLTIVTGQFQPDDADCTAAYVPKTVDPATLQSPPAQWRSNRSDGSLENSLRRANICMQGAPSAVYEARFEFSSDGTAWRLSNAGYRVNSLLTARVGQERNVFYTIEITEPGAAKERDTISLAWQNIGRVKAGEQVPQVGRESSPWLRVPALTAEARRAYEDQTRVHQQVAMEIEATKRAVTRHQRLMAGLDERIAVAPRAVANGLRQQKLQSEVLMQTLQAEIQARNAEYADLPKGPLEFMPVNIEIGVTESRSEKAALMALSNVVKLATPLLAVVGSTMTTTSVMRSIEPAAATPAAAPEDALEPARERYIDRLADYKASIGPEEAASAGAQLAVARDDFNAVRRSFGLEAIE